MAESVLHDIGALSMIGSDSQAMGRVGENFLRAIQTADAMKKARGKLPEDAKATTTSACFAIWQRSRLNPCITAGVSHVLGSIAPGKLADLVLWEPAFFGAKPKMVLKGGSDRRGPTWGIRTLLLRRRSRCSTGPCSAPMARPCKRPA